jgi:hypothetical protein
LRQLVPASKAAGDVIVGGIDICDISVDNPQMSPARNEAAGEVIGDNVILDLQVTILIHCSSIFVLLLFFLIY